MSVYLRRFATVCIALSAGSAFACSSQPSAAEAASVGGATCGFSAPIPKAPLDAGQYYYDDDFVPQGTSVKDYVSAQGLVALDTLIGTYLRGDMIVYKGTLAAQDDQSVLGADCPGDAGFTVVPCRNESITSGPAVASLTTNAGVAVLTVHSLAQHKYVVFQQTGADAGAEAGIPAGVTEIGLVLPDNSAGGNSSACTGCAPAFGNAPTSIAIHDAVGASEVPNLDAALPDGGLTDGAVADANLEAVLKTSATATLTRATPCELTFADLVELNGLTGADAPSLGSFVLQGGDMVSVATGEIETETANGNYCSVSYTLEFYVNASNLADYGVRNYQTFVPDAGYYDNQCSH